MDLSSVRVLSDGMRLPNRKENKDYHLDLEELEFLGWLCHNYDFEMCEAANYLTDSDMREGMQKDPDRANWEDIKEQRLKNLGW